MKKMSLLLVVLLMLIAFASCDGAGGDETTAPSTTEAPADVSITVNSEAMADKEAFISEMEDYGAEVMDMTNAGGGYVFTFSADEHEKLKNDKLNDTAKVFKELENKEGGYIEKIEYDDNFRKISVYVERGGYDENANAHSEYAIGAQALAYQMYSGLYQQTFVKLIYSDTEELASSFSLPVKMEIEQ